MEFKSPYISWANLNCCNGWHYSEEYLLSAVQDNKKICAGITFQNSKDMYKYVKRIDRDRYDYINFSCNIGARRWDLLDLVRKGSLSDYYDLEELIRFYELLGLSWNHLDSNRFMELFNADLFDLISKEDFNYEGLYTTAEFMITGLLLGYPLESTVACIFQLKNGCSQ